MEKISVIIPVYNIGPYLERCVKSVTSQSFRNLQIILVNDGSTDNSLQVCERLRKQDDRITIVSRGNQGSGYARNAGLTIATGDYVTFVDGDDYLAPQLLEHLYQRLQEDQSDIACAHFFRQDPQGTYYFYINKHDRDQQELSRAYSPLEWAKMETNDTVIKQVFYQAWGKLFKRELFDNIEFPRESLGEDNLTTWKLYLSAHKISYLLADEYCWSIRENSLTQADDKSYTSYNNIQAMSDRIQLYATIGLSPAFLAQDWPNWIKRISTGNPQRGELYNYQRASYLERILQKYQH
ncbi:glycosyltransferase family 2 protein [Limosilactobacillus oris]|uniref:glycosyltransferase family 2 protein n=1 Tax=Limosilactobacillus oris TaxID=1632 RepID=UPI0022361605|nr:glycosyltransferase family 2 protein [Limosilactobacillus oris]MCW4387871.1 glycosyltransferase [Limosilactobacillus oris]